MRQFIAYVSLELILTVAGDAVYDLLRANPGDESHTKVLNDAYKALNEVLDMHILSLDALNLWDHSNLQRFMSYTELPKSMDIEYHYQCLGKFPEPIDGVLDGISTLEEFEDAFRQGEKHIKVINQGVVPPLPSPVPVSQARKDELIESIARTLEATSLSALEPASPNDSTESRHRPPLCLQELLQKRLVRLRFLRALTRSAISTSTSDSAGTDSGQ